LKICDFGISIINPEGNVISGVCGSPLIMAPELFREEPYNHMVDWWALGIVIYQMLYTVTPFNIPNQTSLPTEV